MINLYDICLNKYKFKSVKSYSESIDKCFISTEIKSLSILSIIKYFKKGR